MKQTFQKGKKLDIHVGHAIQKTIIKNNLFFKEVGMLLQRRANTSGVGISNYYKEIYNYTSLQHHPLTTPIHSNHTHRFHPLATPASC